MTKKCPIEGCSDTRFVNGEVHPFCLTHLNEFKAAPESKPIRPTSYADFRDRKWKEECHLRSEEKWKTLSEDEKAAMKQGGKHGV